MVIENKAAREFLINNALFLYAYSYFSPTLYGGNTIAGILPFRLKDALVNVLTNCEVHHVTGVARKGQRFVTSDFGLYIIIGDAQYDALIHDKSDWWFVSTNHSGRDSGFKILYPEAVRELIQSENIPPMGNICRLIKDRTKEYIDSTYQEMEQKELESQRAALERSKAKDAFKAYVLSLNPNAGPLIESLLSFDKHYSYSDDVNVWRRGKQVEEQLREEILKMGMSPKDIMERLYKL